MNKSSEGGFTEGRSWEQAPAGKVSDGVLVGLWIRRGKVHSNPEKVYKQRHWRTPPAVS